MKNIISCTTVIDNWGHTRHSTTLDSVLDELKEENWSDDQMFRDDVRNLYGIDDLIGQTIQVCGQAVITLIET